MKRPQVPVILLLCLSVAELQCATPSVPQSSTPKAKPAHLARSAPQGEPESVEPAESPQQTIVEVPVEGCPSPETPQDDESQMWLLSGFVNAYAFLAKWSGQPVTVNPSEGVARNVVCHILATHDFKAIEQAQQGRVFGKTNSGPCVTGQSFSFRLLPPIDDLDGTWHILPLASSTFVTMYEAPHRMQTYAAGSSSVRAEGSFAVRELTWPAWVCPTNSDDVCVAWHPRKPDAKGLYCTDERALPCVAQGYDTEVFILDPITKSELHFGPFTRQHKPRVQALGREILVTTDKCSQRAALTP
jgi:hypothetical protein